MKGIRLSAKINYRKVAFIVGVVVFLALLLSAIQPATTGASKALAQRAKRASELRDLADILVVYAKDHADILPPTINILSAQFFEVPGTGGVFLEKGYPIWSYTARDFDPEVFSENSYVASNDGSRLLVYQRPGLSSDHMATYIDLDLKGKWKWAASDYKIEKCTEQQLVGLISKLDSLPDHLSPDDTLIVAAENGQIDKIEALLDQGLSIDGQDRRGWTALTAATERDQAGAVKLLLSKGAGINGRDTVGMGRTALMRACALGYTDLVEILLSHGSDLQIEADDGTTALSDALRYPEIVQKLITAGANINQHSENQLSPLMAASSLGYGRTVGILIDHGANSGKEGLAALEGASRTGRADAIKMLLSKGVGASKKDLGEDLTWACSYPEAVKALIAGGADLNTESICPGGGTAMMGAALDGCSESVNILIGAGADVNAKDDEGHTVLDLMLASTRTNWKPRSPAEMKALADIIDTLRKHGAIESGLRVDRFDSQ